MAAMYWVGTSTSVLVVQKCKAAGEVGIIVGEGLCTTRAGVDKTFGEAVMMIPLRVSCHTGWWFVLWHLHRISVR